MVCCEQSIEGSSQSASSASSSITDTDQRPRKRRKEEATSSFSSSTNDREDMLKDGVYCLPFKENDQLPSDIVEALRQAEENDDYEFA